MFFAYAIPALAGIGLIVLAKQSQNRTAYLISVFLFLLSLFFLCFAHSRALGADSLSQLPEGEALERMRAEQFAHIAEQQKETAKRELWQQIDRKKIKKGKKIDLNKPKATIRESFRNYQESVKARNRADEPQLRR